MSLTTCKACGKEISKNAKTCPGCGEPIPKQVGILGIICAGIFGIWIFTTCSRQPENSSLPPKTPEQTAVEQKAKLESDRRFTAAVAVSRAIKKDAREPERFIFDKILTNNDASVICVEYRNPNAYGGIDRASTAIINGKVFPTSISVDAWNKHCTKPLFDMTHARQATKDIK